MGLPLNPQLLLQMLQRQGGPGMPIADPTIPPGTLQGSTPTRPDASGGMLNPAGVAPGGAGTAVGAGASTPKNPAIIQDPNDIQALHARIAEQLTSPIDIGAPPEAPNFPSAPTMAPYPSGLRGRLVAGLSGIAGTPNPLEAMRRQQFQDALQQWQAQVSPLQQTYQDRLRAYAEQQRAKTEAAQAQRYGAMATSYLFPGFGISRTGTGGPGANTKGAKILMNENVPYGVQIPGEEFPRSEKGFLQDPQIPQDAKDAYNGSVRAMQKGEWNKVNAAVQRAWAFGGARSSGPMIDKQTGQSVLVPNLWAWQHPERYEPLNGEFRNQIRITAGVGEMNNALTRLSDAAEAVRGNPTLMAAAVADPQSPEGKWLQGKLATGQLKPAELNFVNVTRNTRQALAAFRVSLSQGGATDAQIGLLLRELPDETTIATGNPDIIRSQVNSFRENVKPILDVYGQLPVSKGLAGPREAPQPMMGAPGGGLPSGPATAPYPMNQRTAPPNIRQQAGQNQPGLEQPVYRGGNLVGYTRDGKTISRLPNPGER